MKTRKTFCYHCRKKTTTVYGRDENPSCFQCGGSKLVSISEADSAEDVITKRNLINAIIGLLIIIALIIAAYIVF